MQEQTIHEIPSQNFGIIRQGTSNAKLQPILKPPLPDDYILVQTVTVALNPTDWTTLDAPGAPGTLVGCDYAGVVLAVGPSVEKSFKVGDRVAGLAHGANDAASWNGAFARVIAVKGDLQVKIPDGVGWAEACTTGAATLTAGYALWKVLALKMPQLDKNGTFKSHHGEPQEWVLIYGGSTATGTIAVQFAKLYVLKFLYFYVCTAN